MSTNSIINYKPSNGQPSLQARQFSLAFVPPSQPAESHLSQWADQATVALAAIVEWRSACRRWQAARDIPSDEYTAALEALDAAGLGDWLDNLLAVGLGGVR